MVGVAYYHFVDYRWPLVLLVAFSLAYVIWILRVELDMPVGLRVFLSIAPAFVLYRSVLSLRMLLFDGARLLNAGVSDPDRLWLRSFFFTVVGIAGLVLYHIWRDEIRFRSAEARKQHERLGDDPNGKPGTKLS